MNTTPTVLVTGGNRGLGLAFVQAYLARGARVIATARETNAELDALGVQYPETLDVLPLELERFDTIDALGARLAGCAIDVLIANAALTGGDVEPFGSTDYARFERCLRANAMAPLKLAETFADHVAASRLRIMFFLGSRLGAFPFYGYVGYMTSKTALNQVVKQASLALAPRGVCVVAAHPGWVGTDATAAHGQAPLTPATSAAMLMTIIDGLTIEQTGRFFDPDGSELPLVTQQTESKFYGKPKGAIR